MGDTLSECLRVVGPLDRDTSARRWTSSRREWCTRGAAAGRRMPSSGAAVHGSPQLTPCDRELEPVVLALGAWGLQGRLGDPRDAQIITPDSMTMALRTAVQPQVAANLPSTAYGPLRLLPTAHPGARRHPRRDPGGDGPANLDFASGPGIRRLISGELRGIARSLPAWSRCFTGARPRRPLRDHVPRGRPDPAKENAKTTGGRSQAHDLPPEPAQSRVRERQCLASRRSSDGAAPAQRGSSPISPTRAKAAKRARHSQCVVQQPPDVDVVRAPEGTSRASIPQMPEPVAVADGSGGP